VGSNVNAPVGVSRRSDERQHRWSRLVALRLRPSKSGALLCLLALCGVLTTPSVASAVAAPTTPSATLQQSNNVREPSLPTPSIGSHLSAAAASAGDGYWSVTAGGGIVTSGDARSFGSVGVPALNRPIVGMAATPGGQGYWLVASDGGIFSFGDAGYFGSTGSMVLNRPIVGMAATPDGQGYWLVASDGGIFSFGDAGYFGSTGSMVLNRPIVGMAATPDGKGYWLVASDGGIFSFGDAGYFGSTGAIVLNRPIVGMAATVDGAGYWLVASDGGIFTFGDAAYVGSDPSVGVHLADVVGLAASPHGHGYWIGGADGRVDAFGDAAPLGSSSHQAVVAIASVPGLRLPSSPLAITSSPPPTALLGATYSMSLIASGGTAPYGWTVASGSLPGGLSLSSSGRITGVPDSSGTFTFTVRVSDASTPTPQSATAMLSIRVLPSSAPVDQSSLLYQSSNWSGYVAGGGPFTAVSGTFSVSSLAAGSAPGDAMAEWVGIDGGISGDNSVIQAGIEAFPDPGSPHSTLYESFWETYPAPPVVITSVLVSAGDLVTVNIGQTTLTTWSISLSDTTNGETFTTNAAYSGTGSTAEWIVEAPGDHLTLAPYQPLVSFSGLRVSRLNSTMEEMDMVQDGAAGSVSTPSILTSRGFTVAYGSTAPPPR
jgi:hypothetical protein